MKTSGLIVILMICWDIARLFLQAYVTKRFMKEEFDEIDQALDDVEKAVEEE